MTNPGPVEDATSRGLVPSVLGPSAAMAAALVACKAALLGRPESLLWFRDLVAVTWEDAVWVTACALVGW